MQIAKKAKVMNPEVIHRVKDPVHKTGGITIMYGNLAPDGAVVKSGAVSDKMLKFTGKARVFDSEDECSEAIQQRRSSPATWSSSDMRGRGEARACRKCSARRPRSPAWG